MRGWVWDFLSFFFFSLFPFLSSSLFSPFLALLFFFFPFSFSHGGRDFKDVTNVIPFSLREVASSIEFVLFFFFVL